VATAIVLARALATIAASATVRAAALLVMLLLLLLGGRLAVATRAAVTVGRVRVKGAAVRTGLLVLRLLTVIARAKPATTAAATVATTTTAAATSVAVRVALEELGHVLLGLAEELGELGSHVAIGLGEEGRGDTDVASTAGTTDAVDIVVNVGGQVIVDDVSDVGDVEATRSDGSGDEVGRLKVAERAESVLALALGAVTVDRRAPVALVVEELVERVGAALGLHENQGEALLAGREDVEQDRLFLGVVHVQDLSRGQRDQKKKKKKLGTGVKYKKPRTFWVMFSEVEPTRPTAKKT